MAPRQANHDCVSSPTLGAKCYPSHFPYEVVIVIAAFCICTVYAGTLSISGLYLRYFIDTFEAGTVITTGVISLQASLTYLSCVVVGPLIVRFGTQKVAVTGSLSASVGIFLSGFAFNIIWLYVFYGILTGFGFGILMITAGVSVQEHTNKRRAVAATLTLCGTGLGTFVMPQIAEFAISEYGERGSLLILGGVMLHTLPCALLLKSKQTMDIKVANMIELKRSISGLMNLACNEKTQRYQRRKSLKEVMIPISPDTGSSEFTLAMALIIGAFFFLVGGLFNAYVFSPLKALTIGLGSTEGATLLSLAGIGEVGGRLVGTFLSPCHDKLPIVIYIITSYFMAISCALIGVCRTYTEMMVVLMIYGISSGMSAVVSTTVIRDVVGVCHFALIYSHASAVGGIGNVFCMQISAFIWEKTGDISIPFSIAAGFLTTAGLFILAAFITSIHTQPRHLKNSTHEEGMNVHCK